MLEVFLCVPIASIECERVFNLQNRIIKTRLSSW